MKPTPLAAALIASLLVASASAQTVASNPWVRGTVAQQQSTGAYVQLKSPAGGKLIEARSPAAGQTEIHEMAMDGTTMRMRQVPMIELPAGKTVELKPGGYHLMLMGLKAPLKAGDTVPLTLVIEGKDGKRETLELKAPVKALAQGTWTP
ncbi:copper chaperone PCu(A)C [Aquincola sp. S2]|uniref:Copper chaperone PCu(A)C n=1 Tax=Pseudaquabacterium terrae TaxID=2732868 RepID=A0ABX2EG69_9BURK|nr:copper chaperone PCu(A)C [Aquabacterium terrae]NRF67613.1 copper chaperone PCu(A)C [Aquabacterium terrae]